MSEIAMRKLVRGLIAAMENEDWHHAATGSWRSSCYVLANLILEIQDRAVWLGRPAPVPFSPEFAEEIKKTDKPA